jgi:hypothetical protein
VTIHLSEDRRWLEVDEKRWPVMDTEVEDILSIGRTYRHRKACIRVESGFELSIIWGTGSYSSNYGRYEDDFAEDPPLVEVMIFDRRGEYALDDVIGYLPAPTLNDLIAMLAEMPSDSMSVDIEWALYDRKIVS